MSTEVEIEIGRAFEFQYDARVPEQNTNIFFYSTVYRVGTADCKTRNLDLKATADPVIQFSHLCSSI
ncbi:hypothetical protein T4B_13798 [Trichinella pseudospiralis]|uniref:Uncharacterized protein n=1 Tax=Trichinella pseudospiralis TaxID=6337 RepID=A0A0V1J4Z0_TRIPS|nr:hypothetical protein T4A_1641 [Trichinella pseudospiralis]KRZ23457.1 hypothetical protein T4B_13798 [Trichinella pseudospiralis]KRZ30028.1 hypothetical protein T4C_9227 [Trichinella pseudospiralis]